MRECVQRMRFVTVPSWFLALIRLKMECSRGLGKCLEPTPNTSIQSVFVLTEDFVNLDID